MRRDGANAPAPEHGLWIHSQFVRWGVAPADAAAPSAAMRFFDGAAFAPDEADAYLASLRDA